MAMKPVAMIQLDTTGDGQRHYIALNREYGEVFSTTVHDCGHGASIAYGRLAKAGFRPSDAEWAYNAARLYRQDAKVQKYLKGPDWN